jgi:DNA end-binding protein Ku
VARALWKGLVSFGLVNIPIELHTATRDHTPKFRLLHRTDLSPISLERICQTDGKPVAWNDLVKGYEVEPGRFVAVTEDDFKTAAVERSRSIAILAFVPAASIDARYWETPYVALPGKGAESSYALLTQALTKSGRVGIAKYVMRQRQHLAALVALDDHLLVITMRFPEDLMALPGAPRAKVNSREVNLAQQLVEGMAEEWEPTRYKDDYVSALMKVIEAKAAGKPSRRKAAKAPERTNVVDLMDRLRESLAATRKGQSAAKSQGTRNQKPSSSRKTTRKAAAKRGHAA